jgi:hypothetical protein
MHKTNFFYLFVALLGLLFAIPLADQLNLLGTRLVSGLILSMLLVIGVWSLKGAGRFFPVGMTFAVAGVILNLITIEFQAQPFRYAALLALIGFLLVAITFTLRQVVLGTAVDLNRLVGAVCVFLMIGVIWALFYTLLDLLWPGSFTGIAASRDGGWDSDWLYFSFVTLTTLGYGDISPVLPLARIFASLQAIVGQFYIAVLVAGLVSAYISDSVGSR